MAETSSGGSAKLRWGEAAEEGRCIETRNIPEGETSPDLVPAVCGHALRGRLRGVAAPLKGTSAADGGSVNEPLLGEWPPEPSDVDREGAFVERIAKADSGCAFHKKAAEDFPDLGWIKPKGLGGIALAETRP